MGIFDEPLREIRRFIVERERQGDIVLMEPMITSPLLSYGEPAVLLQEDTAIELGHPLAGSLFVLAWEDGPIKDRLYLLGPNLTELPQGKAPFGLVVMAGGSFQDQYETYRDLRERIYQTRLPGFMVRVFPSNQNIYCRVGREALREGLNLNLVGSALISSLKENPSVEGVEVLFVTSSREDLLSLSSPARRCLEITEALTKMYEEMNFDCESCEYVEVCDAVDGLREIRERLLEKRSAREKRGE